MYCVVWMSLRNLCGQSPNARRLEEVVSPEGPWNYTTRHEPESALA